MRMRIRVGGAGAKKMGVASLALQLTNTGYVLVEMLRNVVFAMLLVICLSVIRREGIKGLLRKLVAAARQLPGVDEAIAWTLKRQVRGFLRQIDPQSFAIEVKNSSCAAIPKKGGPSAMHARLQG